MSFQERVREGEEKAGGGRGLWKTYETRGGRGGIAYLHGTWMIIVKKRNKGATRGGEMMRV
jgi:hypothetical protein